MAADGQVDGSLRHRHSLGCGERTLGGQGAARRWLAEIHPDCGRQRVYNAANPEGHETVLFVEGEFNALLAEQECGGLVGVATLGSASGMLNPRWMPLLLHCKTILVSYDADQAGMKGAARLQALTKRARVVQVPWGKDITEFVLKGGSVKQWMSETLNNAILGSFEV